MTMFEVAKKYVPHGCKLILEKEKSNEFVCSLKMGDHSGKAYLTKVCAPGKAASVCKVVIASAMMGIAIDANDLQMAERWNGRMKNLKWPKEGYEP